MGRLADARAYIHPGPERDTLQRKTEDMSAVDPSDPSSRRRQAPSIRGRGVGLRPVNRQAVSRALRLVESAGQSDRCQHAALAGVDRLADDAGARFKLPALDVAMVRLVNDEVDVAVDVFGLHRPPDFDVSVKKAEIDRRRPAHAANHENGSSRGSR